LDSKRFASIEGRIAGCIVKNCDQFREMFEAYALGALDAAECVVLESHIAAGCADCAKAVEESRWLVSQLAYLAPEATPSDMIRGRLMQTVRAEAQSANRSTPAKGTIPSWVWVGVAALFLSTVYSAWNAQRLEREIQRADQIAAAILQHRHELENQLEDAKREAAILVDPASVKIRLVAPDRQSPALEATWHPRLGIVLSGQKIPVPSGAHVLQLWLIPKSPGVKPIPSLTLRPDADGKLVLLVSNPPELMAETKALAITEEPAGGSTAPTTTPRWVGGVR
jgi:anti-sigma-K factor RskA